MKIELSDVQRKALEDLWFIFGNDGKKSGLSNHKFIQGFLERNELSYFPGITNECWDAVGRVLDLPKLEKAYRKEFSAGDEVTYATKRNGVVPAKVVRAFPKTVLISGEFTGASRPVRVPKSKVEYQRLTA
jgi:hypothetical protein